jgi:hypothetical protein
LVWAWGQDGYEGCNIQFLLIIVRSFQLMTISLPFSCLPIRRGEAGHLFMRGNDWNSFLKAPS